MVNAWARPPQEIREVSLDDVRYTHDRISGRFRHEPHAGLTIYEVTNQLKHGELTPTDDTMVLDVVWYGTTAFIGHSTIGI